MTTLDKVEKNKKYEIIEIRENGPLRQKLLYMGLTPGAEVYLSNVSFLGDPLAFNVRGYLLSLRKEDAKNILVEERKNGSGA